MRRTTLFTAVSLLLLTWTVHTPAAAQPGIDHGDHPLNVAAIPEYETSLTSAPGDIVYDRVSGPNRVETAVAVSRRGFQTADTVVIASSEATSDALIAGPLAGLYHGPLLLTPQDTLTPSVVEEILRLGASRVILIGGPAVIGGGIEHQLFNLGLPTVRVWGESRVDTAIAVAERFPAPSEVIIASSRGPADAASGSALGATIGVPMLIVDDQITPNLETFLQTLPAGARATLLGGPAVISGSTEVELARTLSIHRIFGADRYETASRVYDEGVRRGVFNPTHVWLASGETHRLSDALGAAPAAAQNGAGLLLIDGHNVTTSAPVVGLLASVKDRIRAITMIGGPQAIDDSIPGQLYNEAFIDLPELPGGGRELLPGRTMVALYGSHFTPALGVLGEQSPQNLGPRLESIAGPYRPVSPVQVLPTIDLIATLATAHPGPSGLYRRRSTGPQVQQWLDAARTNDAYLILELQTGRADFLTEARAYESFLRQPDVGLALDPEWRVYGSQRPGGGRIGYVTAAEVNAVSAWLAQIVEEENLPDKALVLHQFTSSMIRDRHLIVDREGVDIIVHMDGHGTQTAKLGTYSRLAVSPPFFNGFKLFYDEDTNMFSPAGAMRIGPRPELITYQ